MATGMIPRFLSIPHAAGVFNAIFAWACCTSAGEKNAKSMASCIRCSCGEAETSSLGAGWEDSYGSYGYVLACFIIADVSGLV